jgi:hypothetical protein
MAEIVARVEAQHDLTIFEIRGTISADELLTSIREFYTESVTKRFLWDAREGSLAGISADEFRNIARSTKKISNCRDEGKTALLGAKEIDYGLGRMYESFAEMENIPCEYRTFRAFEDAMEWLGIPQ